MVIGAAMLPSFLLVSTSQAIVELVLCVSIAAASRYLHRSKGLVSH